MGVCVCPCVVVVCESHNFGNHCFRRHDMLRYINPNHVLKKILTVRQVLSNSSQFKFFTSVHIRLRVGFSDPQSTNQALGAGFQLVIILPRVPWTWSRHNLFSPQCLLEQDPNWRRAPNIVIELRNPGMKYLKRLSRQ